MLRPRHLLLLALRVRLDQGRRRRFRQRSNGTQNNVLTSTDQAPSARLGNVRSIKLEMPQSSISCLADMPVESYTIARGQPAARFNVLVVSREDAASRTLLMQLRVTGTGVFEHYVNDGSSGAGCQSEVGSCISGTTVVKGDTWYHVAVSAKSRGDMHLYVNGFEEASSRPIMQFQSSGNRYDFGYEAGRSTGGFQGVVDEIIVYDWVLSQDRRQQPRLAHVNDGSGAGQGSCAAEPM